MVGGVWLRLGEEAGGDACAEVAVDAQSGRDTVDQMSPAASRASGPRLSDADVTRRNARLVVGRTRAYRAR
jgi:hypothetical protein